MKLIDGCQKKIVELKNSYDQLDEASLITFDENIQMVKELKKVKEEAATEVVDLQREVVTLQRDLLAEKDRHPDKLIKRDFTLPDRSGSVKSRLINLSGARAADRTKDFSC